MKQKTTIPTALLTASLLLLAACGDSDPEAASAEASGDPALEAVFTETAPAGPVSVSQARASAEPGDTITVAGKFAGTMHPFTEGFASAVLTDVDLMTCDLMAGDDHCETPWDACCVDPDTLKSARLIVQVSGPEGRPVAQDLKGVHGLAELSEVIVSGRVADNSTTDNLLLEAESIYVVQ